MARYVEDNLIADERLLYTGRLSPWAFAGRIALGIVLVPVGIGLLLLAGVWIWLRTVELAVTSKRLIVKSGLVSRETIEMNLGKVESLQVNQGVMGRLLGFGSIQVNGTGTSHAPIRGVADPLEFRRQFMQAQDQAIHARQ
jgi:uncharacterized membrane protein YdbT with pleckstrin-like domain